MLCVEALLLDHSRRPGTGHPDGWQACLCSDEILAPQIFARFSGFLFGFACAVPGCALSPLTSPASRLKCQSAFPFFNLPVLTDVEPNGRISIGIITIKQCNVTLFKPCFPFILFFSKDVTWEEKKVKNVQSFLMQLGTSLATLHGSHHLLSGGKYSPTCYAAILLKILRTQKKMDLCVLWVGSEEKHHLSQWWGWQGCQPVGPKPPARSSAAGFSNMIYRAMLTVDFLAAIKVARFRE